MSQAWQRTNKILTEFDISVGAVTPVRLFESGGASGNKERQLVALHNGSTSVEMWYKRRPSTSSAPTISQGSKSGRVLPGETIYLTVGPLVDIWVLSASGTVAGFATEEG